MFYLWLADFPNEGDFGSGDSTEHRYKDINNIFESHTYIQIIELKRRRKDVFRYRCTYVPVSGAGAVQRVG